MMYGRALNPNKQCFAPWESNRKYFWLIIKKYKLQRFKVETV